jgi:4-aminobutyrate aminotransferase-like enzyme
VTYGGNPSATRVARAVMQTIDDDKIQQNSLKIGRKSKRRGVNE